jgi:hypothetical protein
MSQLNLFSWRPRRGKTKRPKGAQEWKIVSVRETAPDMLPPCMKPEEAVAYWRQHIATAPLFNPDVECFAVLLLNIRNRIRGHHLVSFNSPNPGHRPHRRWPPRTPVVSGGRRSLKETQPRPAFVAGRGYFFHRNLRSELLIENAHPLFVPV